MKTTLFFVLASYSCFGIQAQITITNATFPAAGDTLRYALAYNQNPPGFYTPPGGNQIWDFSALTTDATFEMVYRPAVAGQYVAAFPGADLVVITPAGEDYYKVTGTDVELMGYMKTKLFDVDFTWIYHNNPSFKERHAPLNFFDIFQQSHGQLEGMAITDLPVGLMNSIKSVIPSVDSIRLRTAINTLETIDAWGTLTIPGPTPQPQYDVLRQKSTEYLERRIDAKIPPLGWLDITDVAVQNNFGGSANYLGVDTTVLLRFLNDLTKEEIAVLMFNNEQNALVSARYKNNEFISSIGQIPTKLETGIRAYPNPAADRVYFECSHLPAGDYSIRIYDNAGKALCANSYTLTENASVSMNISPLQSGLYYYRMEDQNGKLVGSNRIMVGRE